MPGRIAEASSKPRLTALNFFAEERIRGVAQSASRGEEIVELCSTAQRGSCPHTSIFKIEPLLGWQTVCLIMVVMIRSLKSKAKSVQSKKRSRTKARLISSSTVYRGPVFRVTTDDVQEPGGVRVRRDIIHHTGSVVILAVDGAGSTARVLMERQYRHAAKDYLWELPAGRIDPGEKPLPAAKRELLEETGYTARKWRRILYFYASPGFVAETMSVYLATGLRSGKAQPEDDEVIQMRRVPLSTALRMVLRGTIRDAKTISSVLWLDHQSRAKKGSAKVL
jgi:ADP-ribose pyrophosphatase